jgi:hypothetical protein
MLEYYDKATAPKPKGEINLANVHKICLVDSGDFRAKVLTKTDQDLLFMIQLPHRTYGDHRLLASPSAYPHCVGP